MLAAVLVCLTAIVVGSSASPSWAWGSCPDDLINQPSLPSWYEAWCANVTGVPLDWENYPENPATINLWVTMLVPSDPTAVVDTHLWMLQGGGGRGSLFLHQGFEGAWATFDVPDLFSNRVAYMLPDKRGSGLSTPLVCPSGIAWPDAQCAQDLENIWGDNLAQFTELNAARDLDFLIQQLTVPEVGNNYHLYAWSHGTWLAHKFMFIRTVDPKSIFLDGTVPPDIYKLIDMDQISDSVGRYMMALCGTDPWCSSLWGALDPLVTLRQMYTALSDDELVNTTCAAKVPLAKPYVSTLQALFSTGMTYQYARMLIPPIIYRFVRCNADDVKALTQLFSFPPGEGGLYDAPLQYNIMSSEILLMEPGSEYPADLLSAQDKTYFFTTHAGESWLLDVNAWPRYPIDQYWRQVPNYSQVPVYVVNGNWDNQTPLTYASYTAQRIADVGNAKSVLIPVDYATHGTIISSPVVGSDVPCGLTILATLVTSDDCVPDTTCLDNLELPDWQGTTPKLKALSKAVLGTTNMWGL
ncbi:alpha/beta hydrolase fold [Pelomyxa schiedti]|nr:alpha/beta hydrolase fold [Pelomyxa schiedti]